MSAADKRDALFYQAGGHLPISSHADGVFIWDTEGKRYLDACAGAITCNLGHNHPAIKEAMKSQLDKIAFSYRTQFENEPAIDLAAELVELTGRKLEKVFFVGSGSEAVESCMKLARQYFVAKGEPQRTRFVSLRPSYHGSTLGALGLTGYYPLECHYSDIVMGSLKAPSPDFYRMEEDNEDLHVDKVIAETRALIEQVGGEHIVAIAIEPVGGASTGARMLNQRYFDAIRKLCDEYGCLFILDEVLTGVGRTGEWFAYQHWNATPDIMALAKGMGAGYYPVAAAIATRKIVDVVVKSGGFMHGHTYAGNPLAGATGLAVIQTIKRDNILENVQARGLELRKGLEDLQRKYSVIGHVRGIGLLQAVEIVEDPETKTPFSASQNVFSKITEIAREKHGLLIYPRRSLNGLAGDHFLVSPPLTITADEIGIVLELLDKTLDDFQRSVA
ncbi:aspartate aminotransferase family protein [Emcibacter sp.]|uniref:aminotransferase family protein n=1 Tax=Emcibacter sp. TaxID=1979954 RepID=UPI002AA8EF00|nr:aspartate aminotransferase family protein [Emcibacter sp.]